MFYVLHLLQRESSAPLVGLALCSFSPSSACLTFLSVLLTLSSALVVWCASRVSLGSLLSLYNFSDDSNLQIEHLTFLLFIQMPNGYLYLVTIKKFPNLFSSTSPFQT